MRRALIAALLLLGAVSAATPQAGFPVGPAYTEGSWTPALTTSGTVGTPTYSAQVGSYERFGRSVVVRFTFTITNWTGSQTGNVSITGLPVASFNLSNENGWCGAFFYSGVAGLAANNIGMSGAISPNTSTITLYQFSNTLTTNVTAAQFGTSGVFGGVCFYRSS